MIFARFNCNTEAPDWYPQAAHSENRAAVDGATAATAVAAANLILPLTFHNFIRKDFIVFKMVIYMAS